MACAEMIPLKKIPSLDLLKGVAAGHARVLKRIQGLIFQQCLQTYKTSSIPVLYVILVVGWGKRGNNQSHDHMDQASLEKKLTIKNKDQENIRGKNFVKTWKKLDFFPAQFKVRCNLPNARGRFVCEEVHFA